ncbi:hypothetical protein COLO4_36912 [Corchorus olitorius]|uniref:Uncharacterized protein n=1 Tax=Corchorus olitorius TaxID=93759 RepID=A0A1R3G4C7_9ROSI|nr:hypothetical protein COLO4_36912 [Corchorus olitorius]
MKKRAVMNPPEKDFRFVRKRRYPPEERKKKWSLSSVVKGVGGSVYSVQMEREVEGCVMFGVVTWLPNDSHLQGFFGATLSIDNKILRLNIDSPW